MGLGLGPGADLVVRGGLLYLEDVRVHVPDVVEVGEDERLRDVEAARDDVLVGVRVGVRVRVRVRVRGRVGVRLGGPYRTREGGGGAVGSSEATQRHASACVLAPGGVHGGAVRPRLVSRTAHVPCEGCPVPLTRTARHAYLVFKAGCGTLERCGSTWFTHQHNAALGRLGLDDPLHARLSK